MVTSGTTSIRPYALSTLATGGTISAKRREFDDAHEAGFRGNGDFTKLVKAELSPNISIASTEDLEPAILSENISLPRIELMVDRMLNILDQADSPDLLVVTHGTDSMSQVVNLLDGDLAHKPKDFRDKFPNAGKLRKKIVELQNLLRQQHKIVVFTGSNSSDEDDIKANIKLAFETLNDHPEIEPGIYINFNPGAKLSTTLVRGRSATKAYNALNKRMFYIDKDSQNYKALMQIREHDDNARIDNLHEILGKDKNEMLKHLDKIARLNLTELRVDNKELLKKVRPETKAVLLELYHSSTANNDAENQKLNTSQLIKDIKNIAPDSPIFCVTENFEPVNLGEYASSAGFQDKLISLADMSKNVAHAKLAMLADKEPDELVQRMLKSYIGEIDPHMLKRDYIARKINGYRMVN